MKNVAFRGKENYQLPVIAQLRSKKRVGSIRNPLYR